MHDAELLLAISPLYRVDQVRARVLLLHGGNDTNVPVAESRQLYDALIAAGKEAELVLVPGEGHQFVKPKSRELIAKTMLDFLDEG